MLHVSVHIEIVILTLSVHNVYIMSMLTIYSYNYIIILSLNKYDDVCLLHNMNLDILYSYYNSLHILYITIFIKCDNAQS